MKPERPRFDNTEPIPTKVYAVAKIPTNRGLLSTKYVGDDSMIVSSIKEAEAPGICARVSFLRSLNRLASFIAKAAVAVEAKNSRAGCLLLNEAAYPRAAPAIPDPIDANRTSNI